MTTPMFTIGHGTLPSDDLVALLTEAGVDHLADVRSFPGSRHNPQFGREVMERSLPQSSIDYGWYRDLGGRRRTQPGSRHVALRNTAFRAYADHMESDDFLTGVHELVARSSESVTSVMCSESVWWRCHRRLLADHLVLVRGLEVVHLMHDGRHTTHVPTDGVRQVDGTLVYDVVNPA